MLRYQIKLADGGIHLVNSLDWRERRIGLHGKPTKAFVQTPAADRLLEQLGYGAELVVIFKDGTKFYSAWRSDVVLREWLDNRRRKMHGVACDWDCRTGRCGRL